MQGDGYLDVLTSVSSRTSRFRGYEEEARISEELDMARLDRLYVNNDPRALAIKAEVDRIDIRSRAQRKHAAAQASGLFPGFSHLSLHDALAKPRETVPWVIEGLQRAGHKATLVAQFKTGKTTFSANVVRSLADGVPLLGRFDVHELAGSIGVFDYELTEDDALDQYRSMGLQREDRVYMESLRGTGFTLANDTHAEWTVKWLQQHDIEYLVLDPFGRAMRGFGEENSNDDVRGFFMSLDTIAKEAGLLGILMSVHTGRAAAEVGSERARGATILDDDPDVRWILTRDGSGKRFFRAEGRSGSSTASLMSGICSSVNTRPPRMKNWPLTGFLFVSSTTSQCIVPPRPRAYRRDSTLDGIWTGSPPGGMSPRGLHANESLVGRAGLEPATDGLRRALFQPSTEASKPRLISI